MKVAVFSAKSYDKQFLTDANREHGHELVFLQPSLTRETCPLAQGFEVICAFVNDHIDAGVLLELKGMGIKLIALRCAGFNNVDLAAAESLGIHIVRVPAYSPYAVAEHALALMLNLNRRIGRAMNRVREGNFSLEGLLGFQMRSKTIGIVGFGKIGRAMAETLTGFGCRLLAYDAFPIEDAEEMGVESVELNTLFKESDIVTLHCPLLPKTHHLINNESLARMKKGVMLINTSRGGLVDTRAVIDALKAGKIGYLGLDVYEEEDGLFFENLSGQIIHDDTFARLLTFPNVVITSHQAFFTEDALLSIAETTLQNISDYASGEELVNAVKK